MTLTFFIRLIEETDASRRDLEAIPKVQDMLHGRFSHQQYQKFLSDLYPIVWHFCPIMAAAASRCMDDFIEVRLHLYDSIHEEKGHEKMVLNDLASLGVSASEIIKASPSSAVQAMIGSNYYMAERCHPCSVLGMLYVLEIISSVYGGQVASAIASGLDRPLSLGFSFLESHASMDLDHMSKLRTLLQSIELPDAQNALINSVKTNFYLFMQVLKG